MSSLVSRLHEYVAREELRLPVFSEVAMRVQRLAGAERWEMREVEAAIQSDPSLAAEVLRAANSAFFGGLSAIRSIRAAVVRLGLPQVARIVFLVTEPAKYRLADPHLGGMAKALWRHSAATAMAAQWLARRLNFPAHEEEAFLGGLVHDIGELAILAALDEMKGEGDLAISDELLLEVLETSHAELGLELLTHWSLPEVYRRIVRDHHADTTEGVDVPLNVVRLADQAARKVGFHHRPDPSLVLAATHDAHALGAGEVLLAELEIALEDAVTTLVGG